MSDADHIRVTCPNGHKLRVKPELAGKRVRCPKESCGELVNVPEPESELDEQRSVRINHLFPPDEIHNLPTWRFVLHFIAPDNYGPAVLKRAIRKLKAVEFSIVTFPDGLDALSCNEESNSVGVPVEVPEKRRRRANSLADYESDVWKIVAAMVDSGFGDLYYEAVDWEE